MNSSLETLVKWVKRISWKASITIIITALGTYFAYDSYNRNNSGEIEPVINAKKCKSNLAIALLHTDDTIQFYYPELNQCVRNTSKYSIKNLKINCSVSFLPYDNKLRETFSFEVNPSFKRTSVNIANGHQTIVYTYKQSDFYSGESSQPFLKKITILPKYTNDTTFHYVDITTTVNWEGAEEKKYYSRINIACVPSTIDYNSWVEKVITFTKGKLPDEGVDVILCYKTYLDSLNSEGFPICNRGYYTHFRNLDNTLIDSISLSKPISQNFFEKHLGYIFEDLPERKISWVGIICSSLIFIFALLFLVIYIKEYKTLKIRDKIILLSFSVFLLINSAYLATEELSSQYHTAAYLEIINFVSATIISLFLICFSICLIIEGFKSIRELRQIYKRDKFAIFAFVIALTFCIGATYYYLKDIVSFITK